MEGIVAQVRKTGLIKGVSDALNRAGLPCPRGTWNHILPTLDHAQLDRKLDPGRGKRFSGSGRRGRGHRFQGGRGSLKPVVRLHQERDLNKRALIYGFPYQLQALRSALLDLAEQHTNTIVGDAWMSGKIEIFSQRIAGFGYADCPGHPAWLPLFTRAQNPLR